ncbi:hypothetical protein SS05631_c37330 [Sinorhizobium sp. CCBAU 05631]|nr:hypothetical protein SS05631_c37330 [Sinorhizobium sp. CCBAU 05631]
MDRSPVRPNGEEKPMRRFIRAVAELVQATIDILTFRKPLHRH